jgi:hypothetical protein
LHNYLHRGWLRTKTNSRQDLIILNIGYAVNESHKLFEIGVLFTMSDLVNFLLPDPNTIDWLRLRLSGLRAALKPWFESCAHQIWQESRVATGSDIIQKYSDSNPDFNGYGYSDSDIFGYGYGYRYGMKFRTEYGCRYG